MDVFCLRQRILMELHLLIITPLIGLLSFLQCLPFLFKLFAARLILGVKIGQLFLQKLGLIIDIQPLGFLGANLVVVTSLLANLVLLTRLGLRLVLFPACLLGIFQVSNFRVQTLQFIGRLGERLLSRLNLLLSANLQAGHRLLSLTALGIGLCLRRHA